MPGPSTTSRLRPLGGWDLVSRGRFEARHNGHVWTVDLDYFDFGEKLHLYRDGLEVETTVLTPVDGTAEAWRLQLERERPQASRLIGVVSWIVLVFALVYEVPQLIALIAKAIGADFESPIVLPGAANLLLGLAALAAAIERALRFKSNRWLG